MNVARLGILLTLVLATPAQAGTTLVLPDGTERPQPYQGWVDNSLVPTPDMRVNLRVEACPEFPSNSCVSAAAEQPTVWLHPPGWGPALLHELGHIVSARELTLAKRRTFRAIFDIRARWGEGVEEWFAEGYALCARTRRWYGQHIHLYFGYTPTPIQHRKVCKLMRRVFTTP